MAHVAEDDRVKQACAYLRLLLLRPGEYRARWAGTESGSSGKGPADQGEVDYTAVTEVLGQDEDGGERIEADTVREALAGAALTPATLERFIDAFGLSVRHAGRLRDVLRGSVATRGIT